MQSLVPLAVILAAVLAAGPSAAGPAAPLAADLPGDLCADAAALPTTQNLRWLLGGAALAIAVHQFEDGEGAARALDGDLIDPLADAGNVWGDARLQAPLALATWAAGAWTGSRRTAAAGHDLTRGLLLTYAVTGAIKVGVGRTRPDGDRYSFPSGHTAAAFTVAGVLTRRCGGWVGAASLALGAVTAMGRMEDRRHFASDCAAGAAIGWIVGRTVARPHGGDGRTWRVVPLGRGLAVAGSF